MAHPQLTAPVASVTLADVASIPPCHLRIPT